MMTCYNLSRETEDDDELQNVNIPKSEGSHDVAAPDIPADSMRQPMNIRKVNMGEKRTQNLPILGTIGMRKQWPKSWACCMNSRIFF